MEVLTIVGTFVTASVWMMRTSMVQQRSIAERFIRHLEEMLSKQQEESRLHRSALKTLAGAVRHNSRLMRKLLAKDQVYGVERNTRYD